MNETQGPAGLDDRFASGIPERIETFVGEVDRRPLVSAAGSGYIWVLDQVDESEAARLSVEAGPSPVGSSQELPTSDAVPLELAVTGVRPGTARWRLRLIRPWMPETPLVDRVVDVVVHDRP